MKRLIISLVAALSVLSISLSASAQARYWQVQIFEPNTTTTNRKLNVEYKVLSTIQNDSFTVELFENGDLKGTQAVTHAYGDAGVFAIDLPKTGTYKYFVEATNHGDGNTTKESQTVTVKVVNEPSPTVTVIHTDDPSGVTGGAGGGANGAVLASNGTGTPGNGENNTGNVGENGVSTTNEGTSSDKQNDGSVLGTEAQAANRTRRPSWWLSLPVALVAIGGALYWWRTRQNNIS